MRQILAFALAAAAAFGAVGLAQAPAFAVASVKRNPEIAGASKGVEIGPERLDAIWLPVQPLILQAYGVPASRVLGMPAWARTERYDVRARTAEPSSRQDVLAMLQTLLAERFSLKVHRETREMDIYALVLVKPGTPGPGLHRVIVDCETNTLADGSPPGLFPPGKRPPCGDMVANARFRPGGGPVLVHNRFAGVTMASIAAGLVSTGRPVIDRTGLTGTFDVEMEYISEGAPVTAPSDKEPLTGLTLREALKVHLGLQLRSERGPIEHLVIDSLQRPTVD